MAEVAEKLWSIGEFLAFDDGTDTRYELIGGEIVAMAPATRAHGTLVARLAKVIGNALRPPCEAITEAGIVLEQRADTYYQADLAVTCTPGHPGDSYLAEPVVIVEVLSRSTAAMDLNRKLPDYRAIASVRDILVVSSTEARIEHWQRADDGWRVHDARDQGEVRIEALDLTLDIAELYQGLLSRGDAA